MTERTAAPRSNDPHVVLQLRHIFLGRGFFRERPRQHELGFEDRSACLYAAVERRRHPAAALDAGHASARP